MVKEGNDGRMYVSKIASNGIYRWALVSSKKKRKSPKKRKLLKGGTGVKGITGCNGR